MRAGNVELNEDVLGVVLEFVGMVDAARALRATGKQLRDVAARITWRKETTRVRGRHLRHWRACFPNAVAVCAQQARDLDLPWLRGILTLQLMDCPGVTGEVLQHIESLTTLKVLVGCPDITDEGLRHLGGVTDLTLYDCEQITDEGLRHLGRVTKLHLDSCNNITDEGLRHLGGMTDLSLWGCEQITDEGLRHLGGVTDLTWADASRSRTRGCGTSGE
jgi:hypothetical protein